MRPLPALSPGRRGGVAVWAVRAGQVALLTLAFVVDFLAVDSGAVRGGGSVPVLALEVLAVPFFLLLLLRRRRPRLVLVVVLAFSVLAAALVPDYEPFTALLIALFAAVSRAEQTEAVGWLVATVPLVALNAANAVGPAGRVRDYALAALLWSVIVGIDWTAARLTFRAARSAGQREAALVAETALAVQRERLRLAREIHDIVANTVSGMVLQAAGARAVTSRTGPVDQTLATIEESGVRAMRELRRLLVLLRSDGEDAGGDVGPGASTLDELVEHARSLGVVVDLTVHGAPVELDQSVDHAAHRIVGECLANAATHGGRGARVRLQLQWTDRALRITAVSRRGTGPSTAAGPSTGFGLVGMAERVEALGGTLRHGESGAGEFVVDAELPVSPTVPHPATSRSAVGRPDDA